MQATGRSEFDGPILTAMEELLIVSSMIVGTYGFGSNYSNSISCTTMLNK
jgi:hypothetical protein